MKTRKLSNMALTIAFFGILFASCNDYLSFEKPGKTLIIDAFNYPEDAVSSVTAAYVPLQWEYGGTYFPEWFIGDVCSDDALKGGGNLGDMELVYDLENFKTRTDNDVLLRYYRAQYVGAFRCNLAMENVSKMDPAIFNGSEANLQNRVIGEALFLRAFYHFRLLRIFGGVPIADEVIEVQADWKKPRATAQEVYDFIIKDLKQAIQYLPEKNKYKTEDLGRATKGAARALLMKTYMNNHQYDEAKLQGDTIISSGQYALIANYSEQFTVEGENGIESVFETQYSDEGTGDWGGDLPTVAGWGATRGTLTVVMTRPRWANSAQGWGFNRPTQELYDEFEVGDPRRDAAIYAPTLDQVPPSDDNTTNINVYLGNRYTARKYSMMKEDTTWVSLPHETRGAINRKDIRYADILLLHAEACVKAAAPDLNQAKQDLEQVRARARAGQAILPAFPNYKGYQDNATDLYKAIQHERRVELSMEGHRWFDLVRWGIAAEVMNNYRATTKPQIAEHIAEFVKGKHELFPIPQEERDLNSPMEQNPGYDGAPIQ
ncbi:MAG: RagB/SusD family nutrient uptake outer membrane protein [Candidatus Symbiothrix sp.]|jgi:hypothetical protein|nr:RagB/SusD family nutrient uptake outer membrane protein [Candidatus Symbiothrix sp.]